MLTLISSRVMLGSQDRVWFPSQASRVALREDAPATQENPVPGGGVGKVDFHTIYMWWHRYIAVWHLHLPGCCASIVQRCQGSNGWPKASLPDLPDKYFGVLFSNYWKKGIIPCLVSGCIIKAEVVSQNQSPWKINKESFKFNQRQPSTNANLQATLRNRNTKTRKQSPHS